MRLAVHVDAAHARVRAEGHERRIRRKRAVCIDAAALRKCDDRTSLRRFVGQRGKVGDLRGIFCIDAGSRHNFYRLAVTQRDRSRLIEEQRVNITGRFDRAPAHR